jgi:hypothetical protein
MVNVHLGGRGDLPGSPTRDEPRSVVGVPCGGRASRGHPGLAAPAQRNSPGEPPDLAGRLSTPPLLSSGPPGWAVWQQGAAGDAGGRPAIGTFTRLPSPVASETRGSFRSSVCLSVPDLLAWGCDPQPPPRRNPAAISDLSTLTGVALPWLSGLNRHGRIARRVASEAHRSQRPESRGLAVSRPVDKLESESKMRPASTRGENQCAKKKDFLDYGVHRWSRGWRSGCGGTHHVRASGVFACATARWAVRYADGLGGQHAIERRTSDGGATTDLPDRRPARRPAGFVSE